MFRPTLRLASKHSKLSQNLIRCLKTTSFPSLSKSPLMFFTPPTPLSSNILSSSTPSSSFSTFSFKASKLARQEDKNTSCIAAGHDHTNCSHDHNQDHDHEVSHSEHSSEDDFDYSLLDDPETPAYKPIDAKTAAFYREFALQAYACRSTMVLFHALDSFMQNNHASFIMETMKSRTGYKIEPFHYAQLVTKDHKLVTIDDLSAGTVDFEDPTLQLVTRVVFTNQDTFMEFFISTKFDHVVYNYLFDTTKRFEPKSLQEPGLDRLFAACQETSKDLIDVIFTSKDSENSISIPLDAILDVFHSNPTINTFLDFPITFDYLQITLGEMSKYQKTNIMDIYTTGKNPNANASTTVVFDRSSMESHQDADGVSQTSLSPLHCTRLHYNAEKNGFEVVHEAPKKTHNSGKAVVAE